MPRASTDWKKEEKALQGDATPVADPALLRVILEAGTRASVGNTKDGSPTSRGRLLGIMEENLRKRKKRRHPDLKGLFGGGE
jgi:hypothetical protein